MTKKTVEIYNTTTRLSAYADPRVGMATGKNELFIRLWFEVIQSKIGIGFESGESTINSGKKWFPYNKGGNFRKWDGNNEYVINWENDGREMKEYTASLPQGRNVRLESREDYF